MTTILREMPKASCDFLRFQYGYMETRPEQIPIYENAAHRGMITGYFPGNKRVHVFRLTGFGSTLERAKRMARIPLDNDSEKKQAQAL